MMTSVNYFVLAIPIFVHRSRPLFSFAWEKCSHQFNLFEYLTLFHRFNRAAEEISSMNLIRSDCDALSRFHYVSNEF